MSKKRKQNKFNLNKKDIIFNLIFITTFLIIFFLLTGNKNLFASTIDFKYQHYLIPDYLRTLFYDTHDLFPDFALNLGGGQNIYYLSYYGLLNPIILISYLFPKIKMIDYLITTNCLIVLISTSLFYFYLRKNHYNEKTSFIVSFLLLTSGPLIFHAKRHIMFINYFPFLIIGLYGIDTYLKNKNLTPLTIAITLIIFTSYYFSIPSLIVLFIYGIYKWLKQQQTFTKKDLITYTLHLTYPFILSIMISAIITLPTFYTLLNGRSSTTTTITLKELLTPSITSSLLYTPYSIGLPIISLIALIYLCIKSKKETKFLSLTCFAILAFPIFNYILNGTLYINAKSLIPFQPILLILIADFLNPYLKKQPNPKQIALISYLILSSFTICLITNHNDKLMTKEEINNKTYKATEQLIQQITKEDQSFYRINNSILKESAINKVTNIKDYKTTIYSSTSNKNYTTLYNDILNNPLPNRNKFMIAPSNNILTQILLNEKYILTDTPLKLDFELINKKDDVFLYKNNHTLPFGYASNKLLSKKDYSQLTYPNNAIAILNYIVIENNTTIKTIPQLQKEKLDYTITNIQNITIQKEKDTTSITAKKNASMTINLNHNLTNKILFIRFQNKYNPNKDLAITINNITNKLTSKNWKYFNNNTTFDYVLNSPSTLNIEFMEGTYQLDNFETYLLDYEQLKNINTTVDTFQATPQKTKGDNIEGTINVTNENSYFTISIPYDKGFKILIDNKETTYEKTGANLIAFPISKGKHTIKITYHAPYKKIGFIISIIGIISLTYTKIKSENKNGTKYSTTNHKYLQLKKTHKS